MISIMPKYIKDKNDIPFAFKAGFTHCRIQGTGINFLHFAETFGLWMTLACKGQIRFITALLSPRRY